MYHLAVLLCVLMGIFMMLGTMINVALAFDEMDTPAYRSVLVLIVGTVLSFAVPTLVFCLLMGIRALAIHALTL